MNLLMCFGAFYGRTVCVVDDGYSVLSSHVFWCQRVRPRILTRVVNSNQGDSSILGGVLYTSSSCSRAVRHDDVLLLSAHMMHFTISPFILAQNYGMNQFIASPTTTRLQHFVIL